MCDCGGCAASPCTISSTISRRTCSGDEHAIDNCCSPSSKEYSSRSGGNVSSTSTIDNTICTDRNCGNSSSYCNSSNCSSSECTTANMGSRRISKYSHGNRRSDSSTAMYPQRSNSMIQIAGGFRECNRATMTRKTDNSIDVDNSNAYLYIVGDRNRRLRLISGRGPHFLSATASRRSIYTSSPADSVRSNRASINCETGSTGVSHSRISDSRGPRNRTSERSSLGRGTSSNISRTGNSKCFSDNTGSSITVPLSTTRGKGTRRAATDEKPDKEGSDVPQDSKSSKASCDHSRSIEAASFGCSIETSRSTDSSRGVGLPLKASGLCRCLRGQDGVHQQHQQQPVCDSGRTSSSEKVSRVCTQSIWGRSVNLQENNRGEDSASRSTHSSGTSSTVTRSPFSCMSTTALLCHAQASAYVVADAYSRNHFFLRQRNISCSTNPPRSMRSGIHYGRITGISEKAQCSSPYQRPSNILTKKSCRTNHKSSSRFDNIQCCIVSFSITCSCRLFSTASCGSPVDCDGNAHTTRGTKRFFTADTKSSCACATGGRQRRCSTKSCHNHHSDSLRSPTRSTVSTRKNEQHRFLTCFEGLKSSRATAIRPVKRCRSSQFTCGADGVETCRSDDGPKCVYHPCCTGLPVDTHKPTSSVDKRRVSSSSPCCEKHRCTGRRAISSNRVHSSRCYVGSTSSWTWRKTSGRSRIQCSINRSHLCNRSHSSSHPCKRHTSYNGHAMAASTGCTSDANLLGTGTIGCMIHTGPGVGHPACRVQAGLGVIHSEGNIHSVGECHCNTRRWSLCCGLSCCLADAPSSIASTVLWHVGIVTRFDCRTDGSRIYRRTRLGTSSGCCLGRGRSSKAALLLRPIDRDRSAMVSCLSTPDSSPYRENGRARSSGSASITVSSNGSIHCDCSPEIRSDNISGKSASCPKADAFRSAGCSYNVALDHGHSKQVSNTNESSGTHNWNGGGHIIRAHHAASGRLRSTSRSGRLGRSSNVCRSYSTPPHQSNSSSLEVNTGETWSFRCNNIAKRVPNGRLCHYRYRSEGHGDRSSAWCSSATSSRRNGRKQDSCRCSSSSQLDTSKVSCSDNSGRGSQVDTSDKASKRRGRQNESAINGQWKGCRTASTRSCKRISRASYQRVRAGCTLGCSSGIVTDVSVCREHVRDGSTGDSTGNTRSCCKSCCTGGCNSSCRGMRRTFTRLSVLENPLFYEQPAKQSPAMSPSSGAASVLQTLRHTHTLFLYALLLFSLANFQLRASETYASEGSAAVASHSHKHVYPTLRVAGLTASTSSLSVKKPQSFSVSNVRGSAAAAANSAAMSRHFSVSSSYAASHGVSSVPLTTDNASLIFVGTASSTLPVATPSAVALGRRAPAASAAASRAPGSATSSLRTAPSPHVGVHSSACNPSTTAAAAAPQATSEISTETAQMKGTSAKLISDWLSPSRFAFRSSLLPSFPSPFSYLCTSKSAAAGASLTSSFATSSTGAGATPSDGTASCTLATPTVGPSADPWACRSVARSPLSFCEDSRKNANGRPAQTVVGSSAVLPRHSALVHSTVSNGAAASSADYSSRSQPSLSRSAPPPAASSFLEAVGQRPAAACQGRASGEASRPESIPCTAVGAGALKSSVSPIPGEIRSSASFSALANTNAATTAGPASGSTRAPVGALPRAKVQMPGSASLVEVGPSHHHIKILSRLSGARVAGLSIGSRFYWQYAIVPPRTWPPLVSIRFYPTISMYEDVAEIPISHAATQSVEQPDLRQLPPDQQLPGRPRVSQRSPSLEPTPWMVDPRSLVEAALPFTKIYRHRPVERAFEAIAVSALDRAVTRLQSVIDALKAYTPATPPVPSSQALIESAKAATSKRQWQWPRKQWQWPRTQWQWQHSQPLTLQTQEQQARLEKSQRNPPNKFYLQKRQQGNLLYAETRTTSANQGWRRDQRQPHEHQHSSFSLDQYQAQSLQQQHQQRRDGIAEGYAFSVEAGSGTAPVLYSAPPSFAAIAVSETATAGAPAPHRASRAQVVAGAGTLLIRTEAVVKTAHQTQRAFRAKSIDLLDHLADFLASIGDDFQVEANAAFRYWLQQANSGKPGEQGPKEYYNGRMEETRWSLANKILYLTQLITADVIDPNIVDCEHFSIAKDIAPASAQGLDLNSAYRERFCSLNVTAWLVYAVHKGLAVVVELAKIQGPAEAQKLAAPLLTVAVELLTHPDINHLPPAFVAMANQVKQ